MFKLSYRKYVEALETVKEMEQILKNELETLGESSQKLSANWQGNQSEKTLSMINWSLEDGYHAKALAYTRGWLKSWKNICL